MSGSSSATPGQPVVLGLPVLGGVAGNVTLGASNASNSIVSDNSGNTYYLGNFGGPGSDPGVDFVLDFDTGSGSSTVTHTYNNASTLFLAKYNADGSFGWVRTWGGDKDSAAGNTQFSDVPVGLTVDSNGNVAAAFNVTSLYGTTNYDLDPTAGVLSRQINANNNGVIVSLTSDGDFRWASVLGGMLPGDGAVSDSPLTNLAADGSGNVYFTGRYSDVSGGSGYRAEIISGMTGANPNGTGSVKVTGGGNGSFVVGKLNGAGELQWDKQAWNTDGASGPNMGLAVSSTGDALRDGVAGQGDERDFLHVRSRWGEHRVHGGDGRQ